MTIYHGRFAKIILVMTFLWASPSSTRAQGKGADTARPLVHVVYFVPTDRKPEPDYPARLDRVMTEVQRFYREGMKQNGYGPITFELDRDSRKVLRIHEVRGQGPMRAYGRNGGDKVRREVQSALVKRGLDIDHETVIIFQLLLEWRGDKAEEIGPYVGGGDAHSGTAWVYDDARLDPRLLPSKKPGGYYGGPCSIGQFNTHYIGGVAHELGHALGLPHERERESVKLRQGNSLMGSGNHTYGQELRGEGRGAFLTLAAALPLSMHPLFTGRKKTPVAMICRLTDLVATPETGKLTLSGRLHEGPRATGMIAYNDPQGVPGDYDALGWTCPVDDDGRFRIVIEDLDPGVYDLRLRAYGESGDARTFAFRYPVDRNNLPDVRSLLEAPLLQEALAAFRANDDKRLTELAARVKQQVPVNSGLLRKVAHLQKLLAPAKPRALADVPVGVKTAQVADLEMEVTAVGWGKPLRNQVLPEGDASCLLEVGGTFFESGLYAHAPARYALRLNRGWTTFSTAFGVQDGHDGSVVFVVKGDGKELFRSPTVRDHKVHEQTIKVAGVTLLELLVEDAGDGGNSDWGVWLAPQLRRRPAGSFQSWLPPTQGRWGAVVPCSPSLAVSHGFHRHRGGGEPKNGLRNGLCKLPLHSALPSE